MFNCLVAALAPGGQGCPGTGASNAVLGGAGGHRAVGLCAPNRRASGPRAQLRLHAEVGIKMKGNLVALSVDQCHELVQ